jgi:hypothetical protein
MTPLRPFVREVPVLFMTGSESRTPARAVARLLTGVLPQIEAVEFNGFLER